MIYFIKANMQFCYNVFLICSILLSLDSFSQNDYRPVTKIGGFVKFLHTSGVSGYYLNFERERAFKKNLSFSHGLRIDYTKSNPYYSTTATSARFSQGLHYLSFGYQIKFYPFYFKSHKPHYGIFIGIDPCYFTPIDKRYINGPGLGSLIGYQYVFKNRIYVGLEGSIGYMLNVNRYALFQPSDTNGYFFQFGNIKIGKKFGK